MKKIIDKKANRVKRHKRVRAKISGTAQCPRLNVFRSAKHIYAQLIDDTAGVTLCSASTLEKGFEGFGGNAEAAKKVGLALAEKAPVKADWISNKEEKTLALIDASKLELSEKVVAINRVSKTVQGGRIIKFSALVVVGDGNGIVGFGLGKSIEVPDAIRKGIEDAKKNLVKISLKGTTIPHEVVGKYGAGAVLMKPAPEGTGVIAGGPVRSVIEMAGIKNIRTKSLRSNNPCNVVRATMAGLVSLRDAEQVAALRGKTVKEIFN